MSIGTQLLITAATVAVTVIVTTLINYFLSIPKKIKKQRAEELAQLSRKIDNLEEAISTRLNEYSEAQKKNAADIDLLKLGNQAIIKNELKLQYENWLKKGYAPVDAKDDLERMYEIYHSLGRNGVLTEMHDKFLALPNERVVQAKRKEEIKI